MANMKKVQAGESIDDWIARIPQPQQDNIVWLRNLIKTRCPDMDEDVKWAHPFYGFGKKGAFTMAWNAKHINFQIWNGAHIPDPHGVIDGTGKDIRHIKIHNGKERPEQAILDAIDASVVQLLE